MQVERTLLHYHVLIVRLKLTFIVIHALRCELGKSPTKKINQIVILKLLKSCFNASYVYGFASATRSRGFRSKQKGLGAEWQF